MKSRVRWTFRYSRPFPLDVERPPQVTFAPAVDARELQMIHSSAFLIVFAVGLVLTTATQLRPETSPAGFAELLLSAWVVLSFIALIKHRRVDTTLLPKMVATFWLVALFALAAGLITAPPPIHSGTVIHDSLALLFVALVLLALVIPSGAAMRCRRTLPWLLSLSLVPLFILWVGGLSTPNLGPLSLWYGRRFAGWAENPNQLALLTTPAPFLCFHLAANLSGISRYWNLVLAAVAVVVGLATSSDALRVAWLASGVLLLAMGWARMAMRIARDKRAAVIALGLVPTIGGAAALGLGTSVAHIAVKFAQTTFAAGRQGTDRLSAWREGAEVIDSSPVFGRGPGAHGHALMSAEPMEAHNTFVDWGASSGLFGLSAYVGLLALTGVIVLRRGYLLLFAAVFALTVFSLFNYVVRQPIYWYYLIAAVALSYGPAPTAREGRLDERIHYPGLPAAVK
jgi:O-antigen ligase